MWPKRKPAASDSDTWREIVEQAPVEIVKSIGGRLAAKERKYRIEPTEDPKLAKIRERNRRKSANYRARKKKANA